MRPLTYLRALAVTLGLAVGITTSSPAADSITKYPSDSPCSCANYTGPIYYTVITPDRPCLISVVWGPWIGTNTANWYNRPDGQQFVVKLDKTKADNVPLTIYFPDAATLVNGPFKSDPAFTWPHLSLNWRAR